MVTIRHPHTDSYKSPLKAISVSLVLIQHVNINLPIETHAGPKSYKVEDEINQTCQCDFKYITSRLTL